MVVVTGVGLVSPAGVGVEAAWSGLCAGESTAAVQLGLAGLPVEFACAVPAYDAREWLGGRLAWRLDRFTGFALLAAREAVSSAGLGAGEWEPDRVAVVVGTGSSSMEAWPPEFELLASGQAHLVSAFAVPRSLPSMSAGEVSTDLGTLGPSLTTSTACASGATAIGMAMDLLRAGRCDVAVAGGAESGLGRMTVASFAGMRALSRRSGDPRGASRPFDTGRDGFVLGEGAGFLVLEREADARARGALPLAFLAGYGASADAYHFVTPHPQGRGAELALRQALADAGLKPGDVGHVNAHGTGTLHNDRMEALVLRRMFPQGPVVTANKSIIGHALGASGAIEAVHCVLSLRDQLVAPTANLECQETGAELDLVTGAPRQCGLEAVVSNSFGFGGHNAALAFVRA
ncbi:beta-ketoacyl-[acyl-carrier-protein] synthase family protein [Streptomyces sp. NPDC048269]|uniref:beta-ketoacyl-[acyl-carrier-protein] synthase family protein n=1 Tax=Streptomyces sp. NPDC048269 TaxID=3155753 RepID=UPI00342C0437